MSVSYRGYALTCNPNQVEGVVSVLQKAESNINEKAAELKKELEALLQYAASPPEVSTTVNSSKVDNAVEQVGIAIEESIAKVKGIVNAIVDYSDGDWTDANNKAFLDNFIGTKKNNPSSPDGNGGGDNAASNSSITETTTTPEVLNEELTIEDSTITEESNTDHDLNATDEELVTSQVGLENSKYTVPLSGENTTLNNTDENLSANENANALSNNSTSLETGTFSIPSPISDIAAVKSSSAVGIAGIVAAAAAAIGGKIYYDKKQEDESEKAIDEEKKEELEQISNETGATVIESKKVPDSNVVNFKEEIFKIGSEEEKNNTSTANINEEK